MMKTFYLMMQLFSELLTDYIFQIPGWQNDIKTELNNLFFSLPFQ